MPLRRAPINRRSPLSRATLRSLRGNGAAQSSRTRTPLAALIGIDAPTQSLSDPTSEPTAPVPDFQQDLIAVAKWLESLSSIERSQFLYRVLRDFGYLDERPFGRIFKNMVEFYRQLQFRCSGVSGTNPITWENQSVTQDFIADMRAVEHWLATLSKEEYLECLIFLLQEGYGSPEARLFFTILELDEAVLTVEDVAQFFLAQKLASAYILSWDIISATELISNAFS
ncbi:hypothetical protein B0H14DRAFT_3040656 [Mycena olivaceomarginata]|nr:hypothetical protein B0H14DRAFT_3040656 [Mycena olivaceomarginata]